MNPRIKKRFDNLENQKGILIKKIQNLDDEKINSKAKGGGWTLGQVYYHLFLVEYVTFKYMSKKVKEISILDDVGFKSLYRFWMLKLFLVIPWKYKAPTTVSDTIPKTVNLDELLTNWTELREKYKLLLIAQEDRFLKKKVFKHPLIGYLDFSHAIEFIEAHHRHHFRQINNLLSNI